MLDYLTAAESYADTTKLNLDSLEDIMAKLKEFDTPLSKEERIRLHHRLTNIRHSNELSRVALEEARKQREGSFWKKLFRRK